VTPDAGAQPGGLNPVNGSGPREPLRARPVGGRRDDLGVVGGGDRLHRGRRRAASDRRNLHAGFQGLQWTVTSYTLTLASLILLAASLSDRWGRRRVFLAGLSWFTLASVACAAAPGIGWLIAARAVQGIGGALMTPGQPGHHRGDPPARRPHPRDRDVGRIQRRVRRDRALRGRVAAGSPQLAGDLPDQRPRWPRRSQPDKRPLLCRRCSVTEPPRIDRVQDQA